jgi:hypothetical protein
MSADPWLFFLVWSNLTASDLLRYCVVKRKTFEAANAAISSERTNFKTLLEMQPNGTPSRMSILS